MKRLRYDKLTEIIQLPNSQLYQFIQDEFHGFPCLKNKEFLYFFGEKQKITLVADTRLPKMPPLLKRENNYIIDYNYSNVLYRASVVALCMIKDVIRNRIDYLFTETDKVDIDAEYIVGLTGLYNYRVLTTDQFCKCINENFITKKMLLQYDITYKLAMKNNKHYYIVSIGLHNLDDRQLLDIEAFDWAINQTVKVLNEII